MSTDAASPPHRAASGRLPSGPSRAAYSLGGGRLLAQVALQLDCQALQLARKLGHAAGEVLGLLAAELIRA